MAARPSKMPPAKPAAINKADVATPAKKMRSVDAMVVSQRQIGNRLFQGTGLTAQVLNFSGRRSTSRVASQPPFAGFQEFLRPGVVEALDYPFLAAQLGDAVFAPKPIQHDPGPLMKSAAASHGGYL
jgi:hypothetical protein